MVVKSLLLTWVWSGVLTGWQQSTPIDAVRASTVLVEVLSPRGRSTGSGFVVAHDGTVATAAHVIHGARQVRVKLASGEFVPVLGVRTVDSRLDLALLAVPPGNIVPVSVGDSDSLQVGQRLLALGCPFGLDILWPQADGTAHRARGAGWNP